MTKSPQTVDMTAQAHEIAVWPGRVEVTQAAHAFLQVNEGSAEGVCARIHELLLRISRTWFVKFDEGDCETVSCLLGPPQGRSAASDVNFVLRFDGGKGKLLTILTPAEVAAVGA